jgi:hypothetical protein
VQPQQAELISSVANFGVLMRHGDYKNVEEIFVVIVVRGALGICVDWDTSGIDVGQALNHEPAPFMLSAATLQHTLAVMG